MEPSEIVWELKKNTIKHIIKTGKRSDERGFEDYRKLEFSPNFVPKAEGSCLVKLGNTEVLVGVKMDITEPYPDTPEQGALSVGCELGPLASPLFSPGPPDEQSIEIARVVDRGIRESKMIDLDKLCITPEEKVWNVLIDIHPLDDCGNLIDAASFGAVRALLVSRFPKVEGDKIIYGEKTDPLPIRHIPVSTTFVKIDETILVDPAYEEEKVMSCRCTIVSDEEEKVCAIQKGGFGGFTTSEIDSMLEIAIKRGKDIRKLYG
jgi:exosome complex component RRP42